MAWDLEGSLDQAIANVAAGRSDSLDLTLAGASLDYLESRVAELHGVREIDLGRSTQAIELPTWLRELPALERLDAWGIPLTALPDLPNVRLVVQAETLQWCKWRGNLELIDGISIDADTSADAIQGLAERCRRGELVLTELRSAALLQPDDTRESLTILWSSLEALNANIDDVFRSQPTLRHVNMFAWPLGRVPLPLRELPALTHLNIGGTWPASLPSYHTQTSTSWHCATSTWTARRTCRVFARSAISTRRSETPSRRSSTSWPT